VGNAIQLFTLLVGAIASGFVWAKLTSRMAIPELLKMLTAPLWSAALGLIPAGIWFFGFVGTEKHVIDVRRGIAGLVMVFLVFVPVGLFPSLLGWALGYDSRSAPGGRRS
jgi:membrane protease YdiL (CAAX protease family)